MSSLIFKFYYILVNFKQVDIVEKIKSNRERRLIIRKNILINEWSKKKNYYVVFKSIYFIVK